MTERALVTGASGGIGSATARDLGQDHDVIVHYNSDEEAAQGLIADIEDAGQRAIGHQCDIRDPDAVASMIERARDEFGGVDVLVNNAGVLHTAGLETASDEEIQQTLRVNLEGAIYCSRAVLSGMRERGEGRIVNVASTSGIDGSPSDVAYGASKAGVIGLTKSLARLYTEDGIFTNAVAPGPVKTEMFDEDRRPAARKSSPLDRLVRPEEVAEQIRTFATTSSMTGQAPVVDAGMSL